VTRDELQVAREARAMTRKEVIGMMAAGVLTMLRAADVLGVSRQMRRLRHRLEVFGEAGLMDGRGGLSRKKRVPDATVDQISAGSSATSTRTSPCSIFTSRSRSTGCERRTPSRAMSSSSAGW
jgi:hypothetical protein